MSNRFLPALTVLSVVVIGVGLGDPGNERSAQPGAEPSPKQEGMLRAHEADRQAKLDKLHKMLGSDSKDDQYAAAYLMGYLRYGEAVPALTRNLTLECPPDPHVQKRLPRWNAYPAMQALVHIGKPAVRSMVDVLATSDDAHERGLAARVIFYIEGEDLAPVVMDRAIAKTPDPQKKDRLRSAKPLVKGGEYIRPKAEGT